MDSRTIPEGDVAIMFPDRLSVEQREKFLALLEDKFPDRRFLLLDGGATVASLSPEQLDRIEFKLDALLEALAAEDEGPGPAFDLDGEPLGGQRNPGDEL